MSWLRISTLLLLRTAACGDPDEIGVREALLSRPLLQGGCALWPTPASVSRPSPVLLLLLLACRRICGH